jgi:hypothetical protein
MLLIRSLVCGLNQRSPDVYESKKLGLGQQHELNAVDDQQRYGNEPAMRLSQGFSGSSRPKRVNGP